jgi:transposase
VRACQDESAVRSVPHRKPVRAPLPAHLPRERVVIPAPSVCPCCNGKLVKLGEDVTETLEVIPRQWKVIQTVREKFTCIGLDLIGQVSDLGVVLRASDRFDQQATATGWLC